LLMTRDAVILRVREDPDTNTYWGCARPGGRARPFIWQGFYDSRPSDIRTAGAWVAWGHRSCDRYTMQCGGGVETHNLRTNRPGHRLYDIPSDIEVRANGSVAAILATDHGDRTRRLRVAKHDLDGYAVLDEGPDIDPESLARSGQRLYWTRGGEPRSAVLR